MKGGKREEIKPGVAERKVEKQAEMKPEDVRLKKRREFAQRVFEIIKSKGGAYPAQLLEELRLERNHPKLFDALGLLVSEGKLAPRREGRKIVYYPAEMLPKGPYLDPLDKKVLDALKRAGGWSSAYKISRTTGISQSAVSRHLQKLAELGLVNSTVGERGMLYELKVEKGKERRSADRGKGRVADEKEVRKREPATKPKVEPRRNGLEQKMVGERRKSEITTPEKPAGERGQKAGQRAVEKRPIESSTARAGITRRIVPQRVVSGNAKIILGILQSQKGSLTVEKVVEILRKKAAKEGIDIAIEPEVVRNHLKGLIRLGYAKDKIGRRGEIRYYAARRAKVKEETAGQKTRRKKRPSKAAYTVILSPHERSNPREAIAKLNKEKEGLIRQQLEMTIKGAALDETRKVKMKLAEVEAKIAALRNILEKKAGS